jgi:nucleoside-diphosphate kinase
MQRTLALIKPDAFAAGHTGAILAQIQESGLQVLATKTLHLTEAQAKGFYYVHAERPFFGDLVKFMSEGKIVAVALQGDDAIKRWRDLMGPTNAAEAPKTTIRGQFGTDIERNATHGSDAEDTAKFEIGYFFAGLDLV